MGAIVFWIALLVIMVSYMSLWYGIALYTKRYDVVDSAWGLGFVLLAWVSLAIRANFGMAQVISAVLVTVWGLRLFAHIANRNWRKHEDDQRYQVMRSKWGNHEAQRAYTNVFLLQGILLALVGLPMIGVAFTRHHLTALTWTGWLIWGVSIVFEAVADWQLGTFIQKRPKGARQIMDKGLWRYSRHPNYFGEVATWWGAAIVALSLGEWWGLLGALLITVLVTRISGIPPLEKRYKDDEDYKAYRKRTSVFIPMPPKS